MAIFMQVRVELNQIRPSTSEYNELTMPLRHLSYCNACFLCVYALGDDIY